MDQHQHEDDNSDIIVEEGEEYDPLDKGFQYFLYKF